MELPFVYIITPDEHRYLTDAGDREPLGAQYLSAALHKNNIENRVIDMNHTSEASLKRMLSIRSPSHVALNVPSTPSLDYMRRIGKNVLQYNPKTKLIFGGRGVIDFRINDIADAVVKGDGERAILDIVNNGTQGEVSIPIDVNEYPIPFRDTMASETYKMMIGGKKTAGMVTARGCPYSCTFCGNDRKKIQYRHISNIELELEQIKELGFESVYLYNENLLGNVKHFNEVTTALKKYDLRFRCEARAKDVTPIHAKLLKERGCDMVALGIEAADDKVLKAIQKGETLEEITRGIEYLHAEDIPMKGYFITGLPRQTFRSAMKSIYYANKMTKKGLNASFYTLTPFPHSPIGDNPTLHGVTILNKDYSNYLVAGKEDVEPVIETQWMTKDEIKRAVRMAKEYGK